MASRAKQAGRLAVRNGQTILFIGDSITDCGRCAAERPLGDGYVKLFNDLLVAREPAKQVTIINKGIGGDRITGLRERWSDDVLRFRPDWLSVKIGINDCHSLLRNAPDAVSPQLFCEAYEDILSRTRKALPACKLLLIDPFYISQDTSPDSLRHEALILLADYIAVVHRMHRKYHTRLIRTHEVFQRLLKHHPADRFCPEPVHPHLTGHLVIAEEVYGALSA